MIHLLTMVFGGFHMRKKLRGHFRRLQNDPQFSSLNYFMFMLPCDFMLFTLKSGKV